MTAPTRPFIPVNTPDIGPRERELVAQCLAEGWVSSEGPWIDRFEAACASRFGRRHAIAVTNGSAALDAAVAALRLGPGDEVIVPTFTIISCAAAVVRAGAKPVFVDADPVTWCIDTGLVEAAITPRTRAIMPVHIYGLPCDMDAVLAIAARHGLAVIEDAAEAHGQTYKCRPCGSFGDVSTLSFYANKHVTTGEGGMILTDDDRIAARCRSLRNLFFNADRRFVHEELGWNLRMGSLQAALGLAQLERLDDFIACKKALGHRYRELLASLPGLTLPAEAAHGSDNHYWVFGVVLDESLRIDAAAAIRALAADGVGTRPFFYPMHRQPVFAGMGLDDGRPRPVAERLAARGLYVPSGLNTQRPSIDFCASKLASLLGVEARLLTVP
jgi:perosamine synthetase